jgi:hypothetical protein
MCGLLRRNTRSVWFMRRAPIVIDGYHIRRRRGWVAEVHGYNASVQRANNIFCIMFTDASATHKLTLRGCHSNRNPMSRCRCSTCRHRGVCTFTIGAHWKSFVAARNCLPPLFEKKQPTHLSNQLHTSRTFEYADFGETLDKTAIWSPGCTRCIVSNGVLNLDLSLDV